MMPIKQSGPTISLPQSTLPLPTQTRTGLISESSDGITYMQNLDALIEEAEKDWPKVQVRAVVGRSGGWG